MLDAHDLTRRDLVVAAAFVPLAALPATAQTGPVALTPGQMKRLEAFIGRLMPTDELGPGAVKAGAQVYIDRVLAGPNTKETEQFLEGLEAVNAYGQRTQGAQLADLPAEKRDLVLKAIDENLAEGLPQGRQLFDLALRLTLEGTFGDPYYCGDRNFAGRDLNPYPGPRPAVDAEVRRMDMEPAPYHPSAWGMLNK